MSQLQTWFGAWGAQLRLHIDRMGSLFAPFLHLLDSVEDSVHGPGRAEIDPLVGQGGADGGRRPVHELLTVANGEDGLAFLIGKGPLGSGPGGPGLLGLARAVKSGAGHAQGLAGGEDAMNLGHLLGCFDQLSSSWS